MKKITMLISVFIIFACEEKHDGFIENNNYDIFLIVGQSNAFGLGQNWEDEDSIILEGVDQWDSANDSIVPAVNSLLHQEIIDLLDSGLSYHPLYYQVGFAYAFGKIYYETTNRKCLLIPRASKGSSFNRDNEWGRNGYLRIDAVNETNKAIEKTGGTLKGILWHQGETDALDGVSQALYKNYLKNLVDYFRSNISNATNVPFISGELVHNWVSNGGVARKDIQTALSSITEYISNSACVSSFGLKSNSEELKGGYLPDTIHFSAKSQRVLGKRYFTKIQSFLN